MEPNVNTDNYEHLTLPDTGGTVTERIDELVKALLLQGEVPWASPTMVLLGQYGHLGGLAATQMLARQAKFSAEDIVLDVCCYVGGPARYLAATTGCRVVGVDWCEKSIAIARRLTALAGCQDRVSFLVGDLYKMDQCPQRYTGIWSEGSLDNSLDWLPVLDAVLLPGGTLAITLCVRAAEDAPSHLPHSLDDVVRLLVEANYQIVHCEDLRVWEIEHGWKELLRQLDAREDYYTGLRGADWVTQARERFHSEMAIWSTKAGCALIVARKPDGKCKPLGACRTSRSGAV